MPNRVLLFMLRKLLVAVMRAPPASTGDSGGSCSALALALYVRSRRALSCARKSELRLLCSELAVGECGWGWGWGCCEKACVGESALSWGICGEKARRGI